MNASGRDNLSALRLELNARVGFDRVDNLHAAGLAQIVMPAARSGPHARDVRFVYAEVKAKIGETVRAAVARINIDNQPFGGQTDADVPDLRDALRNYFGAVVFPRGPVVV